MARRFVRNINPNIKEMVQGDECGCAQRIAPWLTQQSAAPCLDPHITGSNILLDPGAEIGTVGDPIPVDAGFSTKATLCSTGLLWPDGTSAINDLPCLNPGATFAKWVSFGIYVKSTENWWTVSNANPRSGSKHIRWQRTSATSVSHNTLGPWIGGSCVDPYVYAARVTPGDIVSFSVYAAMSTTAFGSTLDMDLAWYSSAGMVTGYLSDILVSRTMGASYTLCTVSGTAPANAYYALITLDPVVTTSFPVNGTIDFDDGVLSVT